MVVCRFNCNAVLQSEPSGASLSCEFQVIKAPLLISSIAMLPMRGFGRGVRAGWRLLGQYRHGTGIALGVENLSTWCHELVHAADDRNGKLRGKKVRKETVAELGGAVLLSILGYENKTDLGGCWEGCSFRLMLCGECRAAIVVKVSPELLPTACGESQCAYRALPVAVCEAF